MEKYKKLFVAGTVLNTIYFIISLIFALKNKNNALLYGSFFIVVSNVISLFTINNSSNTLNYVITILLNLLTIFAISGILFILAASEVRKEGVGPVRERSRRGINVSIDGKNFGKAIPSILIDIILIICYVILIICMINYNIYLGMIMWGVLSVIVILEDIFRGKNKSFFNDRENGWTKFFMFLILLVIGPFVGIILLVNSIKKTIRILNGSYTKRSSSYEPQRSSSRTNSSSGLSTEKEVKDAMEYVRRSNCGRETFYGVYGIDYKVNLSIYGTITSNKIEFRVDFNLDLYRPDSRNINGLQEFNRAFQDAYEKKCEKILDDANEELDKLKLPKDYNLSVVTGKQVGTRS